MRAATWRQTIILSLIGPWVAQAAEPENPHVWEPEVRSVAVFKNGMGFFVRDGEVELRDGWCVSGSVPPALFGTFGIYSIDESGMVDVVGAGTGETVEFDGKDGPDDLPGKLARLRSYKGLNVLLSYEHEATTQTSAGRLDEVTDEFVILHGAETLYAIPAGKLTKLEVLDYPLRVHVTGKPADAGAAKLGMAYLRKGITWIPEYSLRIIDETTAELTLRATLVNEIEDLIKTDVHFVVGVPSFTHAEYLTPIAVGQTIRTIAAALPAQFQGQLVSNAIMTRAGIARDQRPTAANMETRPVPVDSGEIDRFMQGLPRIDSAGGSDFTVYTKKGLTVRKGERAIITVFRRKVTYSHYYRWHSPGELKHYLVLHNDTEMPWTTGPVLAVSGASPLCQDIIKYTPRDSRYELPVTTAVNVSTESSESEVARKLKAHQPAHNVFLDLVTIEGHLHVRNFEQRPVELEVRRTVPGLIISASDDGRIRQDVSRLKLTERIGWATWVLKLKPGEQREMIYRYERYVSSR
jgi:hypothetical protein